MGGDGARRSLPKLVVGRWTSPAEGMRPRRDQAGAAAFLKLASCPTAVCCVGVGGCSRCELFVVLAVQCTSGRRTASRRSLQKFQLGRQSWPAERMRLLCDGAGVVAVPKK